MVTLFVYSLVRSYNIKRLAFIVWFALAQALIVDTSLAWILIQVAF